MSKKPSRKPNRNELVALAALQRRELGSICFEPYPSESPDFLLEQTIGIEVRRLDEQILVKDGSPAKADRLHAVPGLFKQIIKDFGQATRGPGWHLLLRYNQEADLKDKSCVRSIRKALVEFLENPEKRIVFRNRNLQIGAVARTIHFWSSSHAKMRTHFSTTIFCIRHFVRTSFDVLKRSPKK